MKKIIIMIAGLPGTGKSTFAKALAGAIDAVHLSADEVAQLSKKRKSGKPLGKKGYDKLLDQAEKALDTDRNLIIDGTFYREAYRRPFLQLADGKAVDIRWIELRTGEEVAEKRLRETYPQHEAVRSIYHKVKELYEPMNRSHLVLWSDQLKPQEMIMRVLDFLSLPS